jgi:hypothetical protein
MIMILCSVLLLKFNSSSKKIMFYNGEIFKKICNRNSTFLLQFFHNIMIIVLFPWTCEKRPYVKTKENDYGRNFLYDTVHQEHV